VTQAQWQAVKGNSTYNSYGQLIGGSEGPAYPAHTMSWDDANDFCVRLSSSSGHTIRLPTESEWEYACRAGTTTQWFWGADAGQLNTYVMSHDATQQSTYNYHSAPPPAGLLQPNPWGLYDILGLISQWTADWYADYPAGPIDDPTGPATGTYKVSRGGNYDCGTSGVRPALRAPERPNLDVSLRWFYGLRVVMEVDVSTGAKHSRNSHGGPARLSASPVRSSPGMSVFTPAGRLVGAEDVTGLRPGAYVAQPGSHSQRLCVSAEDRPLGDLSSP
jgi:formylglycine-generating enzyme required for sulfatase activity